MASITKPDRNIGYNRQPSLSLSSIYPDQPRKRQYSICLAFAPACIKLAEEPKSDQYHVDLYEQPGTLPEEMQTHLWVLTAFYHLIHGLASLVVQDYTAAQSDMFLVMSVPECSRYQRQLAQQILNETKGKTGTRQ